jgi:hypothetical protein
LLAAAVLFQATKYLPRPIFILSFTKLYFGGNNFNSIVQANGRRPEVHGRWRSRRDSPRRGPEKNRVHDVKVVQFARLAIHVEHRNLRVGAETAGAGLVADAGDGNLFSQIDIVRDVSSCVNFSFSFPRADWSRRHWIPYNLCDLSG